MPPAKPGARRGFTLVEVLVALFIFSLVALAVQVHAGAILTQMRRMEERTFASWIARNTLAELELRRRLSILQHASGEGYAPITPHAGEVHYARRQWQLVVETEPLGLPLPVQKLTITVYTHDDRQAAAEQLTALSGLY